MYTIIERIQYKYWGDEIIILEKQGRFFNTKYMIFVYENTTDKEIIRKVAEKPNNYKYSTLKMLFTEPYKW